jgi:hypothetical protein
MGSEKYQPSAEENRKAEEHLTPMQREATENRESVFNAMETRTGVPGALMKKKESGEIKDGPFEHTYEGEINGHKVTLTVQGHRWATSNSAAHKSWGTSPHKQYQYVHDKSSAVVDGIEMSTDDAQKIARKFAREFMNEGATEEDIKKIEEEKRAFQLQEIRKDLGI